MTNRNARSTRPPQSQSLPFRFWQDQSGKVRQAFSGVTAVVFSVAILIGFVSEFFNNPPSTSDYSEFDMSMMPTEPEPGYVWGLADVAEDILLDTETVSDDNIAIILDFSGSMTEQACEGAGQKAWVAVKALETFLARVPADVNLSLIAFDDAGLGLVVPMGDNNSDRVISAITQLVPGGSTPLGEAMEIAVDTLEKSASQRLGNGSYKIVVITDGVANDELHVLHEVKWANLNTPIMTYTAGFCIGTGHPLNQPGETVYASASSADGLLSVLEAAVAEAQDFGGVQFEAMGQ